MGYAPLGRSELGLLCKQGSKVRNFFFFFELQRVCRSFNQRAAAAAAAAEVEEVVVGQRRT